MTWACVPRTESVQGVAVGWQERDYSDESYGEPVSTTGGLRRPPNGTLALMIIHGAAFVLMLMLRHGNGEAIVAIGSPNSAPPGSAEQSSSSATNTIAR